MLPNVSAIYRDLSFMADPKPEPSSSGYAFSQPAQGFLNEKQLRHNQLMEKLRNAQRESSNINQELRGIDTQYQNTSSRGSNYPYENAYQRNDYNQNSNFVVTENSFSSGRGWKPPNIRYRHIEDQKQTEYAQSRTEAKLQNMMKQKLQKEFYENQQRENIEQRKSVKVEKGTGSERIKQDDNVIIQEASESSYGRTWANRESKFQDKLQSYYDLCRKRPASRKVESSGPQHSNKAKFTRTGNNRVVGMQLQKAMKLLSLD